MPSELTHDNVLCPAQTCTRCDSSHQVVIDRWNRIFGSFGGSIMATKFEVGQLGITPGAQELIPMKEVEIALNRHATGD